MCEIIDDNGVIFSGDEEDMTNKFYEILDDTNGEVLESWSGDLKLIKIIDSYR